MLKNIMLSLALAGCVLFYSGCKKDSSDVQVKSAQEHKAEADKAIDASNMSSELEKIEKEIEAEITAE